MKRGAVFLVLAFVFFAVGLIPLAKGQPMKVVFFSLGFVWLVLALALAKKSRAG